MSGATDHVQILLRIDSVGLARAGFGVPLVLSHNAPFVDRVRFYSSIAGVADDFATDSPEHRAANAMFAQSPHPRQVAIGRAAGSVTQRYDIEIALVQAGQEYAIKVAGEGVTDTTVSYTPAADFTFVDADINTTTDTITETAHGMTTGAGPFRLSNSGGALPTGIGIGPDIDVWVIVPTADTFKLATSRANALALTAIDITAAAGGGTHTFRRAQNDVICAQLVRRLNAASGANYTATQVTGADETDTIRVTANAPGEWFSLEINTPAALSIAQTHAAPGDVLLAADLGAILLADQSWYCVIPLYPSTAYLLAVAAFVESNGRSCVYDVVDSRPITTALSGGTDVGAQMLALGFARTMGCYHHAPAEFLAAAEMGRWLPTDPGSATPKFKTLAGISPSRLTDTHKVNLRARRMNAYEQVLPDRAFFWEGTVFSTVNKFFDVTRNSDWLSDEASKALLGVFVGNDIVPFTPEGIIMMKGALLGTAELALTRRVLAGTPPPVVTAPAIEDVPAVDKEERNLRELKLSGALAGAIHKAIPVTVVLTF